MKRLDKVFLVGPMGVGKTTIGRVLAEIMGLQFFDSDREIEASTGADIPWIFDVEGEDGFRIREVRMIDQLSRRKKIVLATGGGAVLAEKNRKRLAKRGVVVYLRASIRQQVERTSRDKNRPLLQTPDPEKKIRELMKMRDPLYREVADIIVDTNRRNPRSVSVDISKRIAAMSEEQVAQKAKAQKAKAQKAKAEKAKES
jgi:shikimate kinase